MWLCEILCVKPGNLPCLCSHLAAVLHAPEHLLGSPLATHCEAAGCGVVQVRQVNYMQGCHGCRTWIRARAGRRGRRCSTPSSRSSASRAPSSPRLPSRIAGSPCVPSLGARAPPPMRAPCPPCTTPPWPLCWPRPQSSMRRRMLLPWLPSRCAQCVVLQSLCLTSCCQPGVLIVFHFDSSESPQRR